MKVASPYATFFKTIKMRSVLGVLNFFDLKTKLVLPLPPPHPFVSAFYTYMLATM